MDISSRILSHFTDAIYAFEQSRILLAHPLAQAIDLLFSALVNGYKILACGNGGSAADAQHFISELVGRFERERLPLAGITLSTDTSILTAIGNDYGFDDVFERQINALGRPGDILVCISTSGNAANLIRAVNAAHKRDMRIVAITGKGGGGIGKRIALNDVHLCVPQDRTMRIQEVHILLLHALCDGIDTFLLGDSE